MRQRTVGSTIGNLLLALVNATLILVLLCLFVGLQLANRVSSISNEIARNLVSLQPVREEVGDMTAELADLRADLRVALEGGEAFGSEAAQRLTDRLDRLDTRLATAAGQFERLAASPELLVDHAIGRAAQEVTQGISELRGCRPADAPGI
ncbi:hypothetical protein [Paracoccus marinaquae]|uniref:Methyl-accepting chemotaxis protein n=1 Tax=Paracoccus marinaquae TaxID=2841926 RepID=A0ABS6ANV7_9RHOB|nr:hypothetical protein [Paracoccus marinaquae]MBU3032270.1 hypothetical protein [Paracoccus marinaquae]